MNATITETRTALDAILEWKIAKMQAAVANLKANVARTTAAMAATR